MKKVSCFIAIQLIGSANAEIPSIPEIIKAHENKPCSAYYNAGQFSTEFCKLIIKSAPDIIKEKLWVLKNSKDPQCLHGRKFLFYGPSGSGKTTLAQVMAQELGRPLLYVNAGKLATEYANSASNNFRRILKEQLTPNSVLVIDEMDCILGEQNNKNGLDINTPTQVWATLDELHEAFPTVLIIGITNKIEKIPDPVRTRFSQLTLKIASNENPELRKEIFAHYLEGATNECDSKFLSSLANKAAKISIRELLHVVTEAKEISAVRNSNPRLISKKDMEEAVKRSLARKKEADQTNTSWVPSGQKTKQFIDAFGSALFVLYQGIMIYNGAKPIDKKINPESDSEIMKKA